MKSLLPIPRRLTLLYTPRLCSIQPLFPVSQNRHASDVAPPNKRPIEDYGFSNTDSLKFLNSIRGPPVSRTASAPRNSSIGHDIQKSEEQIAQKLFNQDLERQMTRKWRVGDVYAPHDLSSVEMQKWRRAQMLARGRKVGGGMVREKGAGRRWGDGVDVLGVDPVGEYKNYSLIWEYCTKMGRIKHSRETGLRNVNQRKMAKAIRRSIGMGLMPSVHNHPEVLEKEAAQKGVKLQNRSYRG